MAINASAWWPDVSDLQKAEKATRYGFWVAVIVATVTAIAASLALYLHTSILGVDATGLVDVVLFAAIAFGIGRKSRVAAVAGLILYVSESAYMLAAGSRSSSSLVLTAIFTLYLVHGVRGTFAYRRLSTQAAAVPAEVITSAASPLAKDSRKAGEDFLVAGCGLLTSFVTALILWFVEKQFGFALYTWMFWFVIPVGALLSGFAGASGYYAGSWLFGHRPTRLLLLNIVVASVATFFLIHYLSYIALQIDGKQVSDYIPFWQYLDIAIRSTSMDFRLRAVEIGKTGELGSFGYAIAFLQVLGFAAGGFGVYSYLVSQPYCEKCSRYLSRKGKQIRYTGTPEGLQTATERIFKDMKTDAIASAIQQHRDFGTPSYQKDAHPLRSVFEVRHCKRCSKHWVRYSVEKRSGDNWREISGLTVAGFTEQAVNV